MPKYLLIRNDNIVVQEFQGGLLVYNLLINKVYSLNEITALVWKISDGSQSIAQLIHQLSKKMKTTVSEETVRLTIVELKKNNLLDCSKEITSTFNGMCVREVIRRVGYTSMASLPVISSIIAPKSAAAQSNACNPTGVQATGTAPNDAGVGLLDCLAQASQKCSNVPPFAFQSREPNICDETKCTCTYDCE